MTQSEPIKTVTVIKSKKQILNTEEEWEKMIENERVKYKSKGFGIVVGSFLLLIYFTAFPGLIGSIYKNFIENYSDLHKGKFTFWSIFLVHHSVFIIYNLILYFIYIGKYSFFEKYRVSSDPWPWEDNPNEWKNLLKSTVITLFVNQMIILPVSMLQFYFELNLPYRLDAETLPSALEFTWQCLFFMLMEDITFYWSHRFLHADWIYPYIHKKHHAYKTTIGVAAEYSHPIEYCIGSLLASNVGPMILSNKVHIVSYLLWIVFRVSESIDGHSGYEFSWSPFRVFPLSGSSDYHAFHHKYYKGNYGSIFSFWDRLFCTVSKQYTLYVHKKKVILEGDQKKIN
jgi:sterol desaturase/sphingolipid hydroxylase (fatty acid hydroxylase superfamily)